LVWLHVQTCLDAVNSQEKNANKIPDQVSVCDRLGVRMCCFEIFAVSVENLFSLKDFLESASSMLNVVKKSVLCEMRQTNENILVQSLRQVFKNKL